MAVGSIIEVTRRLIAVLIVVGLGVGVWILWPRDDSNPPTTTAAPLAVATTTTTTPSTSMVIVEASTTTTVAESHVVETVEEAEEILLSLWFDWFEGIYNQDEDRIREVAASQGDLDAARAQFGVMVFERPPTVEDLILLDVEILLSTESCLAVWSSLDVDGFLRPGEPREVVDVLRYHSNRWKFFKAWDLRGDLWETDCDSLLEPLL